MSAPAVDLASTTAVVLDLAGTFAFALNGALTAVRVARLDIVGVVTLAMITAMGGGILRDVLLGALPPATFSDWRYLVVAAGGGLIAFVLSGQLQRLTAAIATFDALGLSLFAVTGTIKATGLGVGVGQAVLLGTLTAVGGGTLRDVLVRRIPTVLRSELYAIPALLGATLVAVAFRLGATGLIWVLAGAALTLAVRLLGLRFALNAPSSPRPDGEVPGPDDSPPDR